MASTARWLLACRGCGPVVVAVSKAAIGGSVARVGGGRVTHFTGV